MDALTTSEYETPVGMHPGIVEDAKEDVLYVDG